MAAITCSAPSTTPAQSHTRTRVLVVDDSPSFRKMLRYALEQGGYEVAEAADAAQALAAADGLDLDLVLTDLNLPGMNGLALITALRARPGRAALPMLVLTTESGAALRAAGRAAGATGWMVKPFDPDHLIELVHKVAG